MSSRPLFNDDDASTGWKKRGKAPGEDEIDMTPMIDCTFLLLIFFMVASTMQGGREIDLPAARYTEGVDVMRGAQFVTIRAAAKEGGLDEILLGDNIGSPVPLEDIKPYLEAGVVEGKTKVILKAEGSVSIGMVDDVMQVIKGIGSVEVFLGVREE